MPRRDLLTPLGERMLADLPPHVRDDPDYLAVIHCYAKETERQEQALGQLRAELSPLTASDWGLRRFETLLHVYPSGDVPARRAAVVDRYASLAADPAARAWVVAVTALIGPGWTYEEHDPADGASPDPFTLRIRTPFAAGSANFIAAERLIRDVTPSEQELDVLSATGFAFDLSHLDQEAWA